MESLSANGRFFFDLAHRSHTTLYQTLGQNFNNCFEPASNGGTKQNEGGILEALKRVGIRDRKQQLFIRAITQGILSERDLLLSYTVGEYYNEMSLFIEEQEVKKKQLEEQKLKQKTKRR